MTRLEKEFFPILSSNRDKLDPDSVSGQSSTSTNSEFEDENEIKKANESITKVEKASAVVMSDLKAIAECMISSKRIRKSIVDEGLSLLEIEAYKGSRNTKLLESYVRTPMQEEEEHNHALSVHFAWLFLVLLCKLDTKAELYKDVSLSYS
ncbi:hypothetical protein YC2023_032851 [Brassica napus]